MKFFDSYTSYGMPANKNIKGAQTFADLKKELADAGISGAVVCRKEALLADCGGVAGNPLVASDLADNTRSGFYGLWSILPSGSPEFPEPQKLPYEMSRNNIIALKLSPKTDNFPAALWAADDYLALAEERRIPVYINTQEGISDQLLGDILHDFPKLPVVFHWHTVWSGDRWYRALLRHYDNVFIELSHVHTEGFYEDFIPRFGYEKLLFASGWPEYYAGGTVLNLLHAGISETAREAVAYGNIERILKEVKLDED